MVAKGIDDFKVVFSDQTEGAMKNPKIAEAVRDVLATIRQALCDVDTKDMAAVDEAMRGIGATEHDPDGDG